MSAINVETKVHIEIDGTPRVLEFIVRVEPLAELPGRFAATILSEYGLSTIDGRTLNEAEAAYYRGLLNAEIKDLAIEGAKEYWAQEAKETLNEQAG